MQGIKTFGNCSGVFWFWIFLDPVILQALLIELPWREALKHLYDQVKVHYSTTVQRQQEKLIVDCLFPIVEQVRRAICFSDPNVVMLIH